MPTRPLTLACLLLAAVAGAACSTEALHPDVITSGDSSAVIYLVRDDLHREDPQAVTISPSYRVTVDGRFVAWDARTYVQISSNSAVGFAVPAGQHVIGLVDGEDRVVATSPVIETKVRDASASFDSSPAVVFFGGASSLGSRVLLNEPAAVPAGLLRLRLMNAVIDHQPIQAVRCPSEVAGIQPFVASACSAIGDPLSYGDLFERDIPPETVIEYGYHWAAPGAVDPVVSGFGLPYDRSLSVRIHTNIPIRVAGPGTSCPSCFVERF